MKQLILIFGLLIPVLAFAGNFAESNLYKKSSGDVSNPLRNDPLPVQMESKYVTDRSLWGRLIFDRDKVSGSHQLIEDKRKAKLEEKYPLINDPKCKWNERKKYSEILFLLPDNKTFGVPCNASREEVKAVIDRMCELYPGSYYCT